MGTSNKELIQRADIALSDLASNGGIMSPEQTDTFLDMVMEEPTLLKVCRTVRMNGPETKINKIRFASRVLRAAVQTGGAKDDGDNDRYVRAADRVKPLTSQVELNTKEVIAELHIPYEVLEDNIEGANFQDHLMRLIAGYAAVDLEELALGGDTASADAYLALQDGWMKRATSHVVNNLSAGCNPTMFSNGLLALPQKYHRNLQSLSHFVSVANTIRYRTLVAARSTGYGDSMLTQQQPIYAQGVPVLAAPMLAGVSSGTQGLLTFPKNLLFGIQRTIRVETDRDIRSREFIVVLTARVAVQIEEEDACVKYTNIG